MITSRLTAILTAIVVLLIAMALGYYGMTWFGNSAVETAPAADGTATNTDQSDEVETEDAVTLQLRSLSDSNNTSDLAAEIADTPTGDIATELDYIDAELIGL